jgi:serine/threonine protein kinase
LEKLLAYSPDQRLSAKKALKHPYFADLYEKDKIYKLNMKQLN